MGASGKATPTTEIPPSLDERIAALERSVDVAVSRTADVEATLADVQHREPVIVHHHPPPPASPLASAKPTTRQVAVKAAPYAAAGVVALDLLVRTVL